MKVLTVEKIKEIINDANTERKDTFAEFIYRAFKESFVEIYLGDTYEEVSVDQISVSYPSVFCGKVVGAYKECLVIDSAHVKNKKVIFGNLIIINERSIRALKQVDSISALEHSFLRSKESKDFGSFKNE